MSMPEQFPDHTTPLLYDILSTLGAEQHDAGATELAAAALSLAEPEAPPAYQRMEEIALDGELTPGVEPMLGLLADELLGEDADRISPMTRDLLIRHLSAGMGDAIESDFMREQEADDERVHMFLDRVQAGLQDGSLIAGLEMAQEVQAAAPSAGRQGRAGKLRSRWEKVSETARQRIERQAQLPNIAERASAQGRLMLDDLQPGDEVAIRVTAYNYEPSEIMNLKDDPLVFNRTISGKVERVGTHHYSDVQSPKQGVTIRVADDTRNSERYFTDGPFESGSAIVLLGTESADRVRGAYDDVPIAGDDLALGQPPIIMDEHGIPSGMQLSNLGGAANLELTQITINGCAMFADGESRDYRPPTESDPENRYRGVE
jgi:hypothetical protein